MNYVTPIHLILLFFVITCSIVFTKNLIRIMNNLGVVDKPNRRRAHEKVTPRGGGLALVVILIFFLPIFEYYTLNTIANSEILLIIFLPIAIISFLDDIYHIAIPIRLLTHIFCAILAMLWIINPHRILYSNLPANIDLIFGTIILISFLNVYNFLDGIDGITVAESIHLSVTILILCMLKYDIIPNVDFIINIALIILGWSIGFAIFNWQPAKIFPGDVGTISLGFLLGCCFLKIATTSMHLFIASAISCLYYLADGGLTLLIRLLKREKFWQPHLQHFFQKAVKKGMTHKQVVLRIAKCNLLLMLMAINSLYYPIISIFIAIFAVTITLITMII